MTICCTINSCNHFPHVYGNAAISAGRPSPIYVGSQTAYGARILHFHAIERRKASRGQTAPSRKASVVILPAETCIAFPSRLTQSDSAHCANGVRAHKERPSIADGCSKDVKPQESARGRKHFRTFVVPRRQIENPTGFQVGESRPILTIWKISKIASCTSGGICVGKSRFPERKLEG